MPAAPVTWRDQFTVSISNLNAQDQPVVTQLANGNILVAWRSADNSGVGNPAGTDIIGRIFDAVGNPVTGEILLNDGATALNEEFPDVAALPNGGFVVVYSRAEVAGTRLCIDQFDSAGVAGAFTPSIATGSLSYPNFADPQVTVSPTGTVLIAYTQYNSATDAFIEGVIYNPATATFGTPFTSITGNINVDVDAAALTNGYFVIVGREAPTSGTDNGLYVNVRSETGASLTMSPISGTQGGGFDREPVVAGLAGGGFAIAYTSTTPGGETNVLVRTYNSGGIPIVTTTAGTDVPNNDNSHPTITGLPDGSFIVAFENNGTSVNGLEATHFSATGVALGTFVYATIGNDQPNIIALNDGRFASVTWDASSNISLEFLDTRDAVNTPAPSLGNTETQVGTVGNDVFTVHTSSFFVYGGAGNDVITSVSEAAIFGGDGNDTIIADAAAFQHLDGGNGTDTIDFSQIAGFDTQNVNLTTGLSNFSSEYYNGFENVIGSGGVNNIVGTSGVNVLNGAGGNDVLTGGLGADQLIGGAGIDTAAYDDNFGAIFVNLTTGLGYGGAAQGDTYSGIENVRGTNLDDFVIGDNAANRLEGMAGNDTLIGSLGADVFDGGSGIDTVSYIDNQGPIFINLTSGLGYNNAAQGDSFTGVENITGGIYADFIIGNAVGNRIDGGAGDDYIIGALGPDAIIGGDGNDTASYEDNQGPIFINLSTGLGYGNAAEGDTFSGIENIVGNLYNDFIIGDAQANRFEGRQGNDTLIGAGGADTFVFNTALGAGNVDTINDFVHGVDRIELSHSIFAAVGVGPLAAAGFAIGAATTTAQHILYDAATGNLSYDADGSGAGAAIVFATLQGHPTISSADFVIV